MARVVGVEQYRNVELAQVPAEILAPMLRNCIRFNLLKEKTDPMQIGFMQGILKEFMSALHEHTNGLFCLSTECNDEYAPIQQSAFEVRVYFEHAQDMESFKQNFLLLYKLSN